MRKNTKNIYFGAVRRCSFEHYTCHRNLGKLSKKIELRCDYRLLIGKKFHLDEYLLRAQKACKESNNLIQIGADRFYCQDLHCAHRVGQACGNHFLEGGRKYIRKKFKNVNFKKTKKKMSAVPERLRIE